MVTHQNDDKLPSLTIAIPTYNRCKFLDCSLAAILPQVQAALHQTNASIKVLVVDNDSQDDTQSILSKYAQAYGFLTSSRNPSNIGIDGNIDRCVDLAESEYVHLLSDDDFVAAGLYVQLIAFLLQSSPDFIFLNASRASSPTESILEPIEPDRIGNKDIHANIIHKVSLESLLKSAGIWMTFMSSFVVRKESWQQVKNRKDYIGTDIYLSYVAIEMLSASQNIFIYTRPSIFVNAHYSGSYDIMKAFLYNWLPLVSSLGRYGVSSETINYLERQVIASYLPNYIGLAQRSGQLAPVARLKALKLLLRYPRRDSLRALALLSGIAPFGVPLIAIRRCFKRLRRQLARLLLRIS